MLPLRKYFRQLGELLGDWAASTSMGKRIATALHTRYIRSHFDQVRRLAAADTAQEPQDRALNGRPFISFVVPLHNSRPVQLDDLVSSFRVQSGPLCELVLSDDGSTAPETIQWLKDHSAEDSIVILRAAANQGIAAATNAGIQAASGTWIGLIDHDDMLAPFAVARIADTLARHPQCKFLYTDELVVDENLVPLDYFLKPAWDPVLLSGVNYINHLSLYRRDLLLGVGGLRVGYEGSQDYDLLLRYTRDLKDDEIRHLPYPAYIWRRYNDSYSARYLARATANARAALAEHYAEGSKQAVVDGAPPSDLHRVRFDRNRTNWPLVSIVIPNIDALPLISKAVADLTDGTDYPAMEILVIDNGTTDGDVLAFYDRLRRDLPSFRAEVEPAPFNFSRAVNKGIALAKGDYILLLNNDIEVVEPGWLKEMVSCFSYPNVGIVGAKLVYPDGTLQHAGVIAGLGGLAGHWFCGEPDEAPGPMGRLFVRQSLSIVTGACMLVSRRCIDAIGTFDETTFPIAYNDVDFCLRAVARGYRVVWTPFAKLVHHESASRGSDETPENIARFMKDQRALRDRHGTDTYQDRAFSPWYTKDRSNPEVDVLSRLPEAR